MTAASNSDARKRLAEQQAAPVSFANRQSDTLRDILHAYFYSKNTVNWPGSLAEEVAAIVAEHYGAAQSVEAYSVEQIREAFAKHARPDDWGVRAFYEKGLIAALRGEYDAALGGEATP